MKKLLMAAVVLTTILTSCKHNDPKSVLMSFFDALGKKDMDAAKKLSTADSKEMLDMMAMAPKDGKDDAKYDKSKMEFGDAKIDGDKATVAVKEISTGETTNFTLKKEDGTWKVAFDKASLMQMGQDKMKDEKGGTDNSATPDTTSKSNY